MNEPIFTRESEAWMAVAQTLEMLGSMPPNFWNDANCGGLCNVLQILLADGLITWDLRVQMGARIRLALRPGSTWLAAPEQWIPRARWARKFAAAALEEGN